AAVIDGSLPAPVYEVPANRIPADCERITPELLTLVTLSQEEIDRVVATVPDGAANVQDIYPLAPLQEGILFHHSLSPRNDPYVMAGLVSFPGREQAEGYLAGLQWVIDRHAVLRTAVVTEGLSQAVQVVYRRARLAVETLDFPAGTDVPGALQAQM